MDPLPTSYPSERHPVLRWAAAILFVALACGVRWSLQPWLGERSPFTAFAPAALLAAWYGGLGPGLLAAGLGAVVADLMFVPPVGRLGVAGPVSATQLINYLVVSVSGAGICGLLHGARARADALAGELAAQAEALRAELEQRRSSERALDEAEHRYAALFRSTQDGILICDDAGRYVDVNDSFCRILKLPREQLVGRSFHEFMTPEQLRSASDAFTALKSEGAWEAEFPLRAADGTAVQLEWRSQANFVPGLHFCAARDITARKRAEAALHDAHARLHAVIDASPLAMMVLDGQGVVRLWNRAAVRTFGLTAGEVLGRFVPTVPDGEREAFLHRLQETLRGRPTEGLEVQHQRKGAVPFEARIWTAPLANGSDGEASAVLAVVEDVTERQREEERVRDSERRLRLLTDAVPALISYLDANLIYRFVNRAYSEWFGHSADEVIGRSVRDVLGEAAFDVAEPHLRRALAGEVTKYELTLPYRDGGPRHVQAHYVPNVRADGGVDGLYVMVMDLTARKQTEDALKRSERRFAAFMDNLPGAAWLKDREGRYVYVNREAEQVFGRRAVEVLGRTDGELFPPESARQFRENDLRAAAPNREGECVRSVEVLRQADGLDHHSLVSKFAVPGPDGATAYVGGVAIDITDRLQAEQALRESEARFRGFADNSEDVLWIADARQRRLVYASPSFERVYGRPADELYADLDRFAGYVHEEDRGNVVAGWEKCRAAPHAQEYRVVRPDGTTIWIRDRAFPILDEQGEARYVAGIAEDVTDQKQVEQRLVAILSSIDDHIASYDRQWRFTYINERGAQMLGRTPQELLGRCVWDVFPDAVGNQFYHELHEAVREQRIVRSEHFYQGQHRWYENHIYPSVDGVTVFSSDITWRKTADQQVRETEQRFRFLAESIPQIVFTARPDGVVNYTNQRLLDYFGTTREETSRLGWTHFRHPEDRDEATRRWNQAIAAGEPYECTYRMRRGSDGAWRWHLARAVPMRDDAGRIVMWFGTCTDIDDQKRIEDALRASEEEFRAVFELAGSGKALVDPATNRFVRVNRKLCEIVGYSAEELLGMTFADITHPDDRPWTVEQAGRMLRGEVPLFTAEHRYVCKAGGTIWVAVTAVLIRDSAGRAMRAAAVIQDITERKHAEQAIRESEERFRVLTEVMPQLVWTGGPDGYIDYCNHRWLAYTGLSAEQVLGDGWAEALHPDDRETTFAAWRSATSSGEAYQVEQRLRGADGEYRWFLARALPLRDDQGRIVKWLGTNTDIHARRQVELALRESEQRLARAQRIARLGSWELDWTTGEATWSDEMYRLFGVTPGSISPSKEWFFGRVPPEEHALIRDAIDRALRERQPCQADHRIVLPDGSERHVSEHAEVVFSPDGRPLRLVGTTLDITQRKLVEQELAAANRAKDQFLATLSHELRTPLTPVVLAIDAMRRDPQVPAHLLDDLDLVRRNVGLEAKLIDDLLDVTRVMSGKLELRQEVTDVHASLAHALRSCGGSDMPEKQLGIDLECAAARHHVIADPARLEQVFLNLLRNAVKFTPSGGSIRVRTRDGDDGQIVIEFTDTGVGIEPPVIGRIFNAFEQGDRAVTRRFGGLGLGLAICKSIVELHGGSIRAHSEGRGRGTTFTVEMPTVAESRDAAAEAAPAPAAGDAGAAGRASADQQQKRLRILFVEDHAPTAYMMTRLFSRLDYDIKPAADIAEARRLADQNAFDLVVSDLGLPDGSGLELMRDLRDRYGLRGIALSGYGMEEDRRQSRAAGFIEHLVKPISFDSLEAAIRRVLSQADNHHRDGAAPSVR